MSNYAWIPPGKSIEIAGYSIPDGMIYVGDSLSAVNRSGSEPAQINPRLKVAGHATDMGGSNMHYWPSYSDIPAGNRATYLRWLSEGRVDPQVGIGYVFLFFYGLERRALYDVKRNASVREELPAITAEVERLLKIYGSNGSFGGYASKFLEYIKCREGLVDVTNGAPPAVRSGWDLPFEVKLAIGTFVQKGLPIPPEWAFAWFRMDPRGGLKTAGERCPEELEKLFLIRYRERFGEGMVLKRNQTNLRLEYRPASASFQGMSFGETIDVPNVTMLEGPLNKIRKLGYDVQLELDRYSRWVGRTGDRASVTAIGLLPAVISEDRLSGDAAALLSTVKNSLTNEDVAVIPIVNVLRYWPAKETGKLSKGEASGFCEWLSNFGFGVEPDVRFGGSNPSKADQLAVFRLPQGAAKPTKEFESARVLVHLGAALASADDQVTIDEQTHLEAHVERSLSLQESERARLRAFLRWSVAEPPNLTGLKPKLRLLTPTQRAATARFLLAVAGADGHVSADELKILTKVYNLLGLDANALYADVHTLAAAGPDTGPVVLISADPGSSRGYAIPQQQVQATPSSSAVTLDLARVQAVIVNTADVAHILGTIFAGEESGEMVTSDDNEQEEPPDLVAIPSDMVCGLDSAHSEFVRALAAKERWDSSELSSLAEQHGLMPAGAIELVNDAAFAACDEPLLEGDTVIEVNRFALEEMLT